MVDSGAKDSPDSGVRADMRVHLSQIDGHFHFRGVGPDGQELDIDGSGGSAAAGVSPLQLIPMALGSCSGVDVVSILKKGRQPLDDLTVDVVAERDGGKPISMITKLHVHFAARGALEPAKVERAVRLSLRSYCTVAAMLRGAVEITASFSINGDRFDVPGVMKG